MEGVQVNSQRKKYNNGRRYSSAVKEKARELRKKGLTHREIVQQLGISMGSAYLWTIGITLTSDQQIKVYKRRAKNRNKRRWTVEEKMELGKRLKPYQFKRKHTRESLITEIQDFQAREGRIPLKREFNSRRVFRSYFGSCNNAVRAAGFEPNPEFFAKRVEARDGHMCDSLAEAIVDDWLSKHAIEHSRNKKYPGSNMTADFYIKNANLYIEYFGSKGVNRKYDRSFQRKMALVQELNLRLLALFPEDVKNLDSRLSSVI